MNIDLLIFLLIAIITTSLSTQFKYIKQPSLIGEILGGVIIAILATTKISLFQNFLTNHTIVFFSEFGCILLLFEIGLESDIKSLRQHGQYASLIAISGAIIPFAMGYIFATYITKSPTTNFCLFIAATLAATSTGISIRVFKDYHLTQTKSCQIVLAASIIDDIISLVILTIISAIATSGKINLAELFIIPTKIIAFILLLYFGIKYFISNIYTKFNFKPDLAIMLIVCIIASILAHIVGLSSIIGAFLGGMFLDKRHFKNKGTLISPLIFIFVPIFFIYSGMQLNIASLFDVHTILIAVLFSLIAIISKIIPVLIIPHKNSSILDKLIIGFGMVPRGEIGIIIALIGKDLGILNNYYFSIVTLMVIITSITSPIILNLLLANKSNT